MAGLVRPCGRGRRNAQKYVVTPAGKKRFKAWLSEPFGPDQMRSPLILRLAYAGVLTAAQRRALVDQARRVYRAEHDAAEAILAQALDPYSTAVAQYAVALSRAVLKLLDSILE